MRNSGGSLYVFLSIDNFKKVGIFSFFCFVLSNFFIWNRESCIQLKPRCSFLVSPRFFPLAWILIMELSLKTGENCEFVSIHFSAEFFQNYFCQFGKKSSSPKKFGRHLSFFWTNQLLFLGVCSVLFHGKLCLASCWWEWKNQICFQKDCFLGGKFGGKWRVLPMKSRTHVLILVIFRSSWRYVWNKAWRKTIFVKILRFIEGTSSAPREISWAWKSRTVLSRTKCWSDDQSRNTQTISKRSAMIREIREFFGENRLPKSRPPFCKNKPEEQWREFWTHHNALDHNFVLRISFELEHKRLMGGGFERFLKLENVFATKGSDRVIFRNFPCEWYAAYESLETNQQWMEELIRRICVNILEKQYSMCSIKWSRSWNQFRTKI